MPGRYRCEGLSVHRDRFDPAAETVQLPGGGAVTTPDRTAYDLVRWAPSLVERVVAVDTLLHCCRVGPDAVRVLRRRYPGSSGSPWIREVFALTDRRSESPSPTRPSGSRWSTTAEHRLQARARRDLVREADLTAAGWKVLRFDAHVVMSRPGRIVAEVRAELAGR